MNASALNGVILDHGMFELEELLLAHVRGDSSGNSAASSRVRCCVEARLEATSRRRTVRRPSTAAWSAIADRGHRGVELLVIVEQPPMGVEERKPFVATVGRGDDALEPGPHDLVLAVVVVLDDRLEAVEPAGERRRCGGAASDGESRTAVDEAVRVTTHGIMHRREACGRRKGIRVGCGCR